jgi:hypothetical protein
MLLHIVMVALDCNAMTACLDAAVTGLKVAVNMWLAQGSTSASYVAAAQAIKAAYVALYQRG